MTLNADNAEGRQAKLVKPFGFQTFKHASSTKTKSVPSCYSPAT